MRVRGIDHIQLAMPRDGEDQARAFDEGVLGIPEVQKPPNLAKRGGCWFATDSLRVRLGVEDDFLPARKAHAAIQVEDLPGLRRLLEAAGFRSKIDEPLEAMTESMWMILLATELSCWNVFQTDHHEPRRR